MKNKEKTSEEILKELQNTPTPPAAEPVFPPGMLAASSITCDTLEVSPNWKYADADSMMPKPKRNRKPAKEGPKINEEEMAKTLADRVSIFGNKYIASSADDWSHHDGLGWLHMDESESFHSNYRECSETNKWYRKSDTVLTEHGDTICKEVAEKKYKRCDYSGRFFPAEQAIEARDVNEVKMTISQLSAQAQFKTCSVTGFLYPTSIMFKVFGENGARFINKRHFDHQGVKECPQCNKVYESGMVKIWAAGYNAVCKSCFNKFKYENLIYKHDHKGYPIAIHSKKTRMGCVKKEDGLIYATNKPVATVDYRLFGVEVETEMDISGCKTDQLDRFSIAFNVKQALGSDFVMIKEDGTLTMNGKYSGGDKDPNGTGRTYAGFEVVTAPADLAEHRARWNLLENAVGYKHLRAWDTETCGLHVHVSRQALTSLTIGRMLVFINHGNNKKLIHKVAGRSEKKFTKYVQKEASDILNPEKVVNPDETESHNRARRVALNICNDNTVEFRIFRGTVNPRHILRNIEFCDAVCDFCYPCTRSLKDLCSPQAFVDFIDQNRKKWPLLAEWMAHHKLILVKAAGDKANRELITLKPNPVEPEDKTDEGLAEAGIFIAPPVIAPPLNPKILSATDYVTFIADKTSHIKKKSLIEKIKEKELAAVKNSISSF